MDNLRPKILIIGPLPPPFGGGIASILHAVRAEPALQKYRLRYIDTSYSTRLAGRPLARLAFSLLLLGRLCWRLVSFRPGLVHIHSSAYYSFYEKAVMLALCRLAGRQTVLQVHSGRFENFYRSSPLKPLIRAGLRLARVIVAVSPRWREWFQAITPARVELVPNCVSAEFMAAPTETNREPLVLFVGSLVRDKGVFDLLAAAGRLAEAGRDFRLVLAGSAPGERQLAELKEAAGALGADVEIVSAEEPAQVRSLLDRAAVFVLPSRIEGLPVAMLEAMARSLPVVACPVGGVPDLIADGENGFLVEPGNVPALADRLARLLEDEPLRLRMGKINAGKINHGHLPAHHAGALARIYDSLLERA